MTKAANVRILALSFYQGSLVFLFQQHPQINSITAICRGSDVLATSFDNGPRQWHTLTMWAAVTPSIEAFRSMSADAFRTQIALMLERLGHTVVSSCSERSGAGPLSGGPH